MISQMYTTSDGRTPYLPSLALTSLNISSETAAPWLLAWPVLSTKGRWRIPSNPSSHWAFPASVGEMVAPSALMLLVVVVSEFSSTSSMTSLALRNRLRRNSSIMAMTPSSSRS